MLSVTRKVGEAVVVGDIVIQVNKMTGTRVSLHIYADRETRILRGELVADLEDKKEGK